MSSTDDQVAVECPHCHAPLTITVTRAPARDDGQPATSPTPRPAAPTLVPPRGEVQPRPVAEVLADLYAGRRRLDPPAARIGAARARAGLAAARAVAAERRDRQARARAGHHPA